MTKLRRLVISFLIIVLNLCLFNTAGAWDSYLKSLDIQLPFEGGSTWNISCGYQSTDSLCATHRAGIKDEYALDFNMGSADCGKAIQAIANGTIKGTYGTTGYGNRVEIDHGNGYSSFYAHLQSIDKSSGQVVKGERIGTCGKSGTTSCHLHFAIYHNNWSIPPEPMSGYDTFTDGYRVNYTSLNTYSPSTNFRVGKYSNGYVYENTSDTRPYSRPFAVTYYNNKGAAVLGYPINSVHLLENCLGCNSYGAAKVYVQDFQGGACGSATLVMNMLTYNTRFDYLGVAYPIHGQIRDYWYLHFSELGAPVSNEYLWNNKVVQWFEPNDNQYVSVVYDASIQNFKQCNVSSSSCPPIVEADGTDRIRQAAWANLGCPQGDCGVGGDDFVYPPENLTGQLTSNIQVQLNWTQGRNSSDAGVVYRIYRYGLNIPYNTANTSYVDSDLAQGVTYCYKVTAFAYEQESSYSNEVCLSTPNVAAPVANFSISQNEAYSDAEVVFTDASQGNITSRLWDFGDGSTSTSQDPIHRFSVPGLYRIKLTVTGPGGSSVKQSDYFPVAKERIPTEWTKNDINNPGRSFAGYDSSTGKITIFTSAADIWGMQRQAAYISRNGNNTDKLTGDFEIYTKITKLNATNGWAKAGLMIRQSSEPDSPYVLLALTEANNTVFEYNFDQRVIVGKDTAPLWLKLKRNGDIFTAYFSDNGAEWFTIRNASVAMNTGVYYGLFATAYDNETMAEAEFADSSAQTTQVRPSRPTNFRIISP